MSYPLYFLTIYIFCISPGPGIVAVLSRALSAGFWPALIFGAGLAIGDMVYLIAVMLGGSVLADSFPSVFITMQVVGAVWLTYMAWQLWFGDKAMADTAADAGKAQTKTVWSELALAFFISCANPKVIVFYIAVLPGFVDLSALSFAKGATMVVIAYVGLLCGVLTYIVPAYPMKRFLSTRLGALVFNRISAVLLVVVSVWIVGRNLI